MNDLEAFAKLAQALAPWSGQLVYVGGWAHRIHRLDPKANKPEHQAVFTRDTDLAFASATHMEGDIKSALDKSGFKEELSGDFKPPVAHYTLGEENQGFYAEFLTPLAGSGMKRNGQQDATLAKAGITAQKIRHLDILLVDPWVVKLGTDSGVPLKKPLDIQERGDSARARQLARFGVEALRIDFFQGHRRSSQRGTHPAGPQACARGNSSGVPTGFRNDPGHVKAPLRRGSRELGISSSSRGLVWWLGGPQPHFVANGKTGGEAMNRIADFTPT
jgi:hypothetical protein